MVLPKPLRDRVGLRPGEVEVFADGSGLHVEPIASDALEERHGPLVVPRSGNVIDDRTVRMFRDADQK